jgi:RNA polymerase sigma-70 factor (ECF subfamily)
MNSRAVAVTRAIAVYDQHYEDVYRYARSWCHDTALAEDITHDIFLALAEGRTATSNTKAYLFAAVRNRLIDQHRRNNRLAPMEAAGDVVDDTPERLAETDARMPRTLAAIKHELTDDQRHVIVLRLIEGFSLKETARILNKTVNSVKVQQHRGLVRLRKAMA